MVTQILSDESLIRTKTGLTYLCMHGHFYQPPRENPFTGQLPVEPGAAPYSDFNEKITTECYRPNADVGNFENMSYDIGPLWLPGWNNRIPMFINAFLLLNVVICSIMASVTHWPRRITILYCH